MWGGTAAEKKRERKSTVAADAGLACCEPILPRRLLWVEKDEIVSNLRNVSKKYRRPQLT